MPMSAIVTAVKWIIADFLGASGRGHSNITRSLSVCGSFRPILRSGRMNTNSGWLLASLVIGALGTGLAIYGKKQSRWPQLVCGLVLCIYPYFVENLWVM